MLKIYMAARPAISYMQRRLRNEEGQTLIEYALIASLVAIAAILLLVAVGWDIQETFDEVENALGFGTNGGAPAGDDDGAPS
jgi:pilus assembly protein Flp/PilA